MNIVAVFLQPTGRVGRPRFWIAVGSLWVFGVLMNLAPSPVQALWTLPTFYMAVCVYGKRLHDMGRSAWLFGAYCLVLFVVTCAAFLLAAWAAGFEDPARQGVVGVVAATVAGSMAWLAFTIWVGAGAGQDGPNRYGPVPRERAGRVLAES